MRLSAGRLFIFAAAGSVCAVWCLPAVRILIWALPLLFLLLACALTSRYFPIFYLCMLALSFFWLQQVRMLAWPATDSGTVLCRECYAEGRVTETPRSFRSKAGMGGAFTVAADRLIFFTDTRVNLPFPAVLRVLAFNQNELPQAGDRIRVRGTVARRGPPLNPYDRNERFNLRTSGISWEISAFSAPALTVLKPAGGVRGLINRLRSTLLRDIGHIWHDPLARKLFEALITGERSGLNRTDWDLFRRTGTAHLLAVSGLHMTLLAGMLFSLMLLAGYRYPAAAVFCGLFALAYTGVAGGAVPVARAGVMACFLLAALAGGRKARLMHVLYLTALAFLVLRAGILLDVSFQLSFMAVYGLIRFSREPAVWTDPAAALRQDWLMHAAAAFHTSVILLPFLAHYFGAFAPAGLIANFMAIPLLFLSLLAAFLSLLLSNCGLPPGLAAWTAEVLMKTMLKWLEAVGRIPLGSLPLRIPGGAESAVYFMVLFGWLLLCRKLKFSGRRLNTGLAVLMMVFISMLMLPPFAGPKEPVLLRMKTGWMLLDRSLPDRKAQIFYEGRRALDSTGAFVLRNLMRRRGIQHIEAFYHVRAAGSYSADDLARLAASDVRRMYYPIGSSVAPPHPFAEGMTALQTGDRSGEGAYETAVWSRSQNRLGIRFQADEKVILILPPLTENVIQDYRRFCGRDCKADLLISSTEEAWEDSLWSEFESLTDPSVILAGRRPAGLKILRARFCVWPDAGIRSLDECFEIP